MDIKDRISELNSNIENLKLIVGKSLPFVATDHVAALIKWIKGASEVLRELAYEGCYCSDPEEDLGDDSPCRSCLAKTLIAEYSKEEL